jgi:hypothetical protein
MRDFNKLANLLEEMRNLGLEEYILFGVVIGRIIDGTSDSSNPVPLSDAEISIRRNNNNVRNLRSGTDGMYTIYLRSGRNEQIAEKAGYIPFIQGIYVTVNETLYMPAMELIPISDGTGSVSGQIIDSITGRGIQGASIEIFDQHQTRIAEIIADRNGYYEFSNNNGYYRVAVNALGYMETQRDIAVVGNQVLSHRDLTMSPVLQDGEIRIVLTWGLHPRDLDSHLYVPLSNGSRFHISYQNMSAHDNGVLAAFLDLDDTDSYGPETITVYRAIEDGIFSYIVHDFTNRGQSNSTALANSGANVKVYLGNDYVREYNVPPGILGDTWYVFDLVNGELRPPSSSTWDW